MVKPSICILQFLRIFLSSYVFEKSGIAFDQIGMTYNLLALFILEVFQNKIYKNI